LQLGCDRNAITLPSENDKRQNTKHMEERNFLRPAVSLIMLLAGLAMDVLGVSWFTDIHLCLLWYIATFLPVGLSVIRKAAKEAKKGDPFSEFMLMSVASVGAFAIGEYPEAVAVMLFYRIGETLQDMAVDRARDNINGLMAFRPDRATIIVNGQNVQKRPEEVKIGDFIEVYPGDRVPLDGILTTAAAEFNTAALTGESVPRLIQTGQEVLAGMIATNTPSRLCVVREAKDSAVSRIFALVEEATNRKAPAELFIRKFARIYTPTVICLAALTAILPWLWSVVEPSFCYSFSSWFYRALVFLVISCPCALVISVPLSYFAGIGAASTMGVLFKGGNWLDVITNVDTVIFDKTGTLTTGEFRVVKVDETGEKNLLNIVAAMEKGISHPIAKAIVREGGDSAVSVTDVRNLPGRGVTAVCNGSRWVAGTLCMLDEMGVSYPQELKDMPETIVACACNGAYAGCLLLADTLKEDAAQAVKDLKSAGVKQTVILSGDKQALVSKVAATLQVSRGYGDLMPEGKVKHIEAMRREGHCVAFVGDGINDAPVLAASNVSIAMGAMGADMAVETADIVLQTDQPCKVAAAIQVGRTTRSVVRQNIVFAISVKVLIMILGAAGMANLWVAVFADVGVALMAVLNAMRILLRFRRKH